ncbi:MAG: pentapeptide repeat-containing protein [Pseudomonadota bacterium]
MPDTSEAIDILRQGVEAWNAWRDKSASAPVSLAGTDLSDRNLDKINFMRTDLTGCNLDGTELRRAHLKDADLTGASLIGANLEHVNARQAVFAGVQARDANFSVATLRRAVFPGADLTGARFHRAYLRQASLERANLTGAWMRFATFEKARCEGADFTDADLRYASMVRTDLRQAKLSNTYVFGVSAWQIRTDRATIQDLNVSRNETEDREPLRVPDLETAQLMALMLDGGGVRSLLNATANKMVLILGSFAADEKPVLDALRVALRDRGYVAIVFDFQRPDDRGFAETVVIMAGLSRFVVADFTNPKEIRREVPMIREQYRRVPIAAIAKSGGRLPITMIDYFDDDEIAELTRYDDIPDLLAKLDSDVIAPAEAEASRIAERLKRAEAALRE